MTLRRRTAGVIGLALALALAIVWTVRSRQGDAALARYDVDAAALPAICRTAVHEDVRYVLCTVDPNRFDIAIHLRQPDGRPFGTVGRFAKDMMQSGRAPVIAMNAGMYHADMTPVGLHVEGGSQVAPVSTADGFGNFFLKPNGVFLVDAQGRPAVMETDAYLQSGVTAAMGTQSGPMLLIGGQIHPRILPNGTTRYIRNGVGVNAAGEAVFAVSLDPVSFGGFARFFRDEADCPDALFFDGEVSSLWAGTLPLVDSGRPAGPIVAVFERDG